MVSDYEFSPALLSELRQTIAERGVVQLGEDDFVAVAKVPEDYLPLLGKELPRKPLAVIVDVYGTLLASAVGDIGPVAGWDSSAARDDDDADAAFPHDMAARLKAIVTRDHAQAREAGIPWPEVFSPSVFARALDLPFDDAARAAVAWECTANPCSIMPGADRFLHCCRRQGLTTGIVSNAQFYTPLFIEVAFGASLSEDDDQALFADPDTAVPLGFDRDLLLWSWETGRAKPDDWMFRELASRLSSRGVAADRVLFVGNDALNDCAAAGRAGMMTALFCGDDRSFKPRTGHPDVAAHPPTVLVQSWEDLRRQLCT